MRRWQYPSLTEVVSTAGERITVDKWRGGIPEPQPKERLSAAQVPYFFEVPQEALNIPLDRWFFQEPDVIRPPHQVASVPSLFFVEDFVVAEVITVDKWLFQEPDVIRPPHQVREFYALVEVDPEEEINLDKWFTQEPDVIRPPHQVVQGFVLVEIEGLAEDITLDKWFFQEPDVIRPLHQVVEGYNLVEAETAAEDILLDKWFFQEPDVVRPDEDQHTYPTFWFDPFPVAVAEPEVELDKWDPRLFMFPLDRERLQYLNPALFMPEREDLIPPVVSVDLEGGVKNFDFGNLNAAMAGRWFTVKQHLTIIKDGSPPRVQHYTVVYREVPDDDGM